MPLSDGKNLTEKVYRMLRQEILYGRYPAGVSLTEESVAKEYAVSRTPVREALRQLELAGLVKIIPNKGAVVEGISDGDIDDIYEIRRSVERLAVERAAENAGEGDIAKLKEILELAEFYYERGDSKKFEATDGVFHETLFLMSGRRILCDILTNLHGLLIRIRGDSMRSRDRAEQTLGEHRAIFGAIAEHNPKLAGKLTVTHIENSYKNIKKLRGQNEEKR